MNWERLASVEGAALGALHMFSDERGSLPRLFASDDPGFSEIGVAPAHVNFVALRGKGTTKGLHFQAPPSREAKLLTCLAGEIFDVLLDTRTNSATFGAWVGLMLTSSDPRSIFIPAGVAHGMQNMSDQSLVHYIHTDVYSPGLEKGVNALDPALGIHWPVPPINLSERDRDLPSLEEAIHSE